MNSCLLLLRVSLQDYLYERRYAVIGAVVLAAILTPLLVLFGLKHGIVDELFQRLRQDPTAIEIRPVGEGLYDQQFFDRLQSRDDVLFFVEDTRFLASTIRIRRQDEDGGVLVRGSLVPTAAGDPLWDDQPTWQEDTLELVLSWPLAEKLNAAQGTQLFGEITRDFDGDFQSVSVKVTVKSVMPLEKSRKDIVLAPLEFLVASESYREGFTVERFASNGRKGGNEKRTFSSFRLYARSIEDVRALRDYLENQQIVTKTALKRIQLIQQLDSTLSKLYWVIAGLAACGYALSVGGQAGQIVVRKTKDLGVLKLLGFSSRSLVLFPVVQSMVTGAIGASVAITSYYLVEFFINDILKNIGVVSGVTSRLPVQYSIAAIIFTLVICFLTSFIGGLRASRVLPAEGLRYE